MISFNLNVAFNRRALEQRVENANRLAQMQLDQDVLKDSNYFIPKDTSFLEGSGVTQSQIGNGKVMWVSPYARKLYYNPQYNFSKDTNPNAQGLWFEAAKAQHRPNWLLKTRENYRRFFGGGI